MHSRCQHSVSVVMAPGRSSGVLEFILVWEVVGWVSDLYDLWISVP
jgi:hypothetical protein